MGVDASIEPREGGTLGNASAVRDALSQFVPGIEFKRCENRPFDPAQLEDFVAARLPPGTKFEIVKGATAPFFYQGMLREEGWSMVLEFDDSDCVPDITVSFYGNFDYAQIGFDASLPRMRGS